MSNLCCCGCLDSSSTSGSENEDEDGDGRSKSVVLAEVDLLRPISVIGSSYPNMRKLSEHTEEARVVLIFFFYRVKILSYTLLFWKFGLKILS